jgi:phosphate starvation-inducible PhoH-like protein
MKRTRRKKITRAKPAPPPPPEGYSAKTRAQAHALDVIGRSTISFVLGPAGTGKTHLASGYAVQAVLDGRAEQIVITRPSVATEQLGFLPGSAEEKVGPYLVPFFDAVDRIAGKRGQHREKIASCIKVAPLAYMRGRSQPLDAKVLTPSGYRSMGDIRVGDEVIGSDGLPTEVLGVYPQGELDVFRVAFSDGTSAECSEDHLWLTATRRQRDCGDGHSVRTTSEVKKTLKSSRGASNHSIPVVSPIRFSEMPRLPIPPYTLGVFLGDGSMGERSCVHIVSADQMIQRRVEEELPAGMVLATSALPNCAAKQYRPVRPGGKRAKGANPVKESLRELGLVGTTSSTKFIPQAYLLSSVSDRIDLLRGLMDTDGTIYDRAAGTPRVLFRTTSPRLAEGVQFLVQSLGGTAAVKRHPPPKPSSCNGRSVVGRHDQYTVDVRLSRVNPFHLNRKAKRWRPHRVGRRIASVELIGKKECQCIRVASPDSLYLTDHCIVTHNTFHNSVMIFDESQNATFGQLKLFLTRIGSGSQVIVTGDADQSDLPRQERRLVDVMQRLAGLKGVGVVEFKASDIVRNPIIEGVLRELER